MVLKAVVQMYRLFVELFDELINIIFAVGATQPHDASWLQEVAVLRRIQCRTEVE